jgi:hypothetical protein
MSERSRLELVFHNPRLQKPLGSNLAEILQGDAAFDSLGPVSCQTELSRLLLRVTFPGAPLVPRSIASE